jgi:hypothetical protein
MYMKIISRGLENCFFPRTKVLSIPFWERSVLFFREKFTKHGRAWSEINRAHIAAQKLIPPDLAFLLYRKIYLKHKGLDEKILERRCFYGGRVYNRVQGAIRAGEFHFCIGKKRCRLRFSHGLVQNLWLFPLEIECIKISPSIDDLHSSLEQSHKKTW